VRHSCWGFIESACMKTSLPDAGNTLYGPRASGGPPAPRRPGAPGSRVARAAGEERPPPPRAPIRRTSGVRRVVYVLR
jgi:hypothetical protein